MVLKKYWGRIVEELLLRFWPPTKGNQHSMTSNLSQLDKNDDHPRGHVKAPRKSVSHFQQEMSDFFFLFFGFTFRRGEQHQTREREARRGGRAVGMEGGAAVEARRR